jgi:hypothetical protein
MKEHIVYILGAGFSRPLGLPLVRDFLFKAKDLYAKDRETYAHFDEVFKSINSLASIKTFYESDQLDIEELLSILTMSSTIEGKQEASSFSRLIIDVINAYTTCKPEVGEAIVSPNSLRTTLFRNPELKPYLWFVSNLLGLRFSGVHHLLYDHEIGRCVMDDSCAYTYDAITLNYDLILEKAVTHINAFYRQP